MARKTAQNKSAQMGSTVAAIAFGAFAMGTGAPGSSAQASISPDERASVVQTYRIPAGSMGAALNAFADKNGLHLIYDAQVTRRLKSSGLSGAYSVKDGLGRLLAGTGLTYRFAGDGEAVSIILAQNSTGTQTDAVPAGAEPLPTIEVGAARPVAGGSGDGQGTSPGIAGPVGSETGTGPGGYGGAGPAQDPYNKSYVLQNASTGTKTDTPVMDTPLNVQSVPQQVLQDQQATTLTRALQNVSGVTVTDASYLPNGTPSYGFLLRGFNSFTYYRDGFRLDSGTGSDIVSNRQLANIASAEVLKGPGAILYGISEPGGVINITTKEPLDTPYYAVQQQFGSLADYRTTIDATGPLNADKSLLYRMNMSYENNGAPFGSFVDLTHSQSLFVAPVVKWNIDAATWVKLEAEYTDTRSDDYFAADPLLNGALVNFPRNTNYGTSSPSLTTNLFAALTWGRQFDKDWSVKQQIAYNYTNFHANATYPFFISTINNLPVFTGATLQATLPQTTYSTNVDITGHINTFGAEHTLLLGGDVYWETGSDSTVAYNGTTFANSLFNPLPLGVGSVQCPCIASSDFVYTQDTAGLYLQDQVKLPYNFFLLTGARYQYIRQSYATGELNNLQPALPLTGQALTPRFGLLWRPQEWLSLYGNYTEGFGSNGTSVIYPGELAPPSSAKSWEAGAKFELFGGKLRATADYFELVKTNVPFPDTNPAHICGGGGLGSCSLLAGAARSTGPELDIQGEILPGWSVIAAYTNDDVRVTKAQPNDIPALGGSLPAAGQRFPGVARNQASLWTTYEFQNDSVLRGWKFGAGYHYMGSRPVYDTANYVPYIWPLIPSYGTVDLMGAYSFVYAGSKMTAQLNITNLFDRTYYGSVYNANALAPGLQGGAYRSYGAPFAVMGSLRAELDKGATAPPWLLPTPTASPSLPGFTWTGLYAGGQMGYGWGDNDGSVSFWGISDTTNFVTATPFGLTNRGSLGSGAQGVIGGFHLGYNQQFDRWVLGLEGSVDAATLQKSPLVVFPDPAFNDSLNSFVGGTVKSEIQGSIRARAGYAFGRLLPYATGGVAFGSFYSDLQLAGGNLPFPTVAAFAASGNASATKVGWTLGGGLEYAVDNHWSMRAEYRYSDFGSLAISSGLSSIASAFVADRHLAQNQVQVGFSYKLFAGPELEAPPAPKIVKGPALAANDLPKPAGAAASPPLVMNWTGFYLGAQIGYGWGLNDGSITYATPGGLAGQSNLSSSAIVVGGSSNYNGDAIGVIGGAHLGYNQQFDKWVVGVEGSVDPTLMSRGIAINVPNAVADPTGALGIGATATGAIWSTIQGSVRARAGYALDRMMFYGTGGVALGEFGSTFQLYGNDTTLAPFYAADMRSSTRAGWTVGGGVEYAVNPHWSVRGEYRYTDFGHLGDSPAATSMGVAYAADRHLDQNQVQVGLSYKFGEAAPTPVAAKY